MKTRIILAALAMIFFTIASVQAEDKKHDDGKHQHMDKTTYTCSMHPEIKSDKPGKCPKCGMKMVEKKMDHKKMDMKKMKKDDHDGHEH